MKLILAQEVEGLGAPGDIVELDGGLHRCVRLAASPYPGDRRRCAVLERVRPAAA